MLAGWIVDVPGLTGACLVRCMRIGQTHTMCMFVLFCSSIGCAMEGKNVEMYYNIDARA